MKLNTIIKELEVVKVDDLFFIPIEECSIKYYKDFAKDCGFEPEIDEKVVDLILGFKIPDGDYFMVNCYVGEYLENETKDMVRFNIETFSDGMIFTETIKAYIYSDDAREYFLNSIIKAMIKMGKKYVTATYWIIADEKELREYHKRLADI